MFPGVQTASVFHAVDSQKLGRRNRKVPVQAWWFGGGKKHDCNPQPIFRTKSEQERLMCQGVRTRVLKLAFFLSACLAGYWLRCSQFENWT